MFSCQEWDKFLITDQELAESYEKVGDLNRSWMKKFIAYLFCFYGHDSRVEYTSIGRQRAGFIHEKVSFPVSKVAIFADNHLRIWNRLLAAAIPAVAAGTNEISVFMIKNQDESCPELLTSLELAGIENIFLNDRPDAVSAAELISNSPDTSLIDLSSRSLVDERLFKHPPGTEKYLRLSFTSTPRGLIWAENLTDWDYEILKWAHPDIEFIVGGVQASKAPEDFIKTDLEIHQLLQQPYDLFLGNGDIFRSSMIARGFSQGMEPFWLWPEIDRSFFMENRVYWKEI